METIELSPLYVPLIQKPMCCAIACLQMILYRNNFGLFDQEQMAVDFGVKILPELAPAFSSAMPVMTSLNFDEGIQTVESESRINAFFRDRNLSLEATVFKKSDIVSMNNFLFDNLSANRDIWVEYHGHNIHANDADKGQYIHDGLIESFNLARGQVTIIDPAPRHRQRVVVSLPTLKRAVSDAYGRETGFVVVRNTAPKICTLCP